MVQSVKCLPLKHEDLCLDSQDPHKQQDIAAACTCNTSAGEGETGRPLGLLARQSSQTGELWVQ